jgi:hypothetical protein
MTGGAVAESEIGRAASGRFGNPGGCYDRRGSRRKGDERVEGNRILLITRTASIVVVVVAIVAQAVELASHDAFNPTRFFAYFTIQSNVIGVAAFAWLVANRGAPRSHALESFRGAAAAYLTVTFLVVIALLSNVDVGLGLAWVDFVVHKLFPVIVVLDWLVDPPTVRLSGRDVVAWMVYPIVWLALTLGRGAADGWYPYPFLDPANGGYGAVVVTSFVITIGFVVLAAAYVWLGNRLGKRRLEAQPA